MQKTIPYIKNPKDATKKLLELINEFANVAGYKINTINEMKNTLEWINSRITEAEEWISDLENRMVEFTAAEQNKEKTMKKWRQPKRPLGQH